MQDLKEKMANSKVSKHQIINQTQGKMTQKMLEKMKVEKQKDEQITTGNQEQNSEGLLTEWGRGNRVDQTRTEYLASL